MIQYEVYIKMPALGDPCLGIFDSLEEAIEAMKEEWDEVPHQQFIIEKGVYN